MMLLNDPSGTCIMQLDRKHINCARKPNGENRLLNNWSKLRNLWKKLQIVIRFEANLLKSVHLYSIPKAFLRRLVWYPEPAEWLKYT